MSEPGGEHRPAIWVVSPIYYDVQSWILLRDAVLTSLSPFLKRFAGVNFIVIDDSAGLDPEIAEVRLFESVFVVTPPFNLGHQRALVYGLRMNLAHVSDSDVVVTLDGDGEDKPEDLPRLLRPLVEQEHAQDSLVLAHRTKRHASLAFKATYALYAILFRVLTGTIVKSGNYAVYRGNVARKILSHPYFDLCYSATLLTFDLPTTFVSCERGLRYGGKSRMSYSRLILHGLRMLMPFTDRIALRAIIASSVVFFSCLVAAVAVLSVRFLTTTAIPGWATSTLLLVLILSFVTLGNFMVMLVVFSQARGFSLSNLECSDKDETTD